MVTQVMGARALGATTNFHSKAQPSACRGWSRESPRIIRMQAAEQSHTTRREAGKPCQRRDILTIGGICAASLWMSPSGAQAAKEVALLELPSIAPFSLDDLSPEAGWTELDSGLRYIVDKEGEGDKEKGIFEKVDHFQPFPFVSVIWTAYTPDGKPYASSTTARRTFGYQAGVRQELQDENGAVMSMKVGEKRRFAVPLELASKRKAFGALAPQKKEVLLFQVELTGIQPY